eukprot:642118-Rhodomonas_salina.5
MLAEAALHSLWQHASTLPGMHPLCLDGHCVSGTWDSLNGIEKTLMHLVCCVIDVCVYEQQVCLGVHVLHHHLEAIETTGLWNRDLVNEVQAKVLQHNAIAGCKEG